MGVNSPILLTPWIDEAVVPYPANKTVDPYG
jgi:hypothetical protein